MWNCHILTLPAQNIHWKKAILFQSRKMFYFYFLCLTRYRIMLLLHVCDIKINNNEIKKSKWEIWRIYFKGIFFNLKYSKNKHLEIFSEVSPGLIKKKKKCLCSSKFITTKICSKKFHLDRSLTNSSYIVIIK